jgi:pimeloyl-ACP methyl ester carboxylesterase
MLDQIRMPTLVLHGERDTLVPVSNAKQLAGGIAGAELHVLPGAGHALGLERPVETVSLIRDWLARRRPQSAPPP